MKLLYVWVLALSVAACADKKPAAPPPPQGFKSLSGDWNVKLDEKQQHELNTMNLMFQPEEPSKEALDALSPEERQALTAIRAARLKSPDDPQYLKMKNVVESMAGTRLWIGTSSLTLTIGNVREESAITLQTDTATVVLLKAKMSDGREQPIQFSFEAGDQVRMSRPGQREALTFVRARK